MIITSQMKEKISLQLQTNPLVGDELRRVEGMGLLFVSLSLDHIEEYRFLYSLEMEGKKYHFFTK